MSGLLLFKACEPKPSLAWPSVMVRHNGQFRLLQMAGSLMFIPPLVRLTNRHAPPWARTRGAPQINWDKNFPKGTQVKLNMMVIGAVQCFPDLLLTGAADNQSTELPWSVTAPVD